MKEDQKNVALVLSSGGARGLAHIGAIEELEANGYKISSIAGCSMGALRKAHHRGYHGVCARCGY